MIHIERNKFPIPSIFGTDKIHLAQQRLNEFYQRSENSRSQERFHKPFAVEIKKEILDALKYLFNNKCAYCESQIQPSAIGEIDHFRPRSGARGLDDFSKDHYWWLTYEWRNMNYSCSVCNRYKATWFPVEGSRCHLGMEYDLAVQNESTLLLDPCNVDPKKHLFFRPDGKVDFLTQEGRVTIEILKLNRDELIKAREEANMRAFSLWEEFSKKWHRLDENYSRIQEISLEWENVFSPFSIHSYSASMRQLLLERFEVHPEIGSFITNKMFTSPLAPDVIVLGPEKISNTAFKKATKKKIEQSLDLKKFKHVYLDKLHLKNYKCFSDLEIKFNDASLPLNANDLSEEKQPGEPWLLFLGENGVGKSSILKAIAIALMSNKYRKKIKDYIIPATLLKDGASEGFINLYLKGNEKPIEIKFNSTSSEFVCSNDNTIPNMIGYGSVRLLPNKRIQPEKINSDVIKSINLFDYSIALENATQWLLSLDEVNFNRAASTLKDLMSLGEGYKLHRKSTDDRIFVISPLGTKTYVDQLSDGYQSVYSLAVDIMSTLSSEEISYDVCEAIVLIDEIGTHLHPRWKMEVVSQLRHAFPRIQFIVTTHEPLCLRGLTAGETVVLNRDDNNEVIAITDLPNPSELRVDQILTSEFFGLRSTLDPDTERAFNEYYEILGLDDELRTDVQRGRLFELSRILPKIKHLGDTLREELVYFVVDELLAKQVKTDGLKIRDDLKDRALNRVKLLWESLNKGQ